MPEKNEDNVLHFFKLKMFRSCIPQSASQFSAKSPLASPSPQNGDNFLKMPSKGDGEP